MQATAAPVEPPAAEGQGPPASASRRRRGALLLVASAAVFPLTGLSARRLRDTLPSVEITFLWCAISAGAFLLASAWGGVRLRPKDRRLFVWRGICGAVVTGLFFLSVQLVPLGRATVLLFSSPIWVALFAALRGVERPSPPEWVFALLAVGGVVLTVEPVFGDPGWGEALALLAAVVGGGSAILVREMRRRGESVACVYFAFLLCGTFLFAIPAFLVGRVPARSDLPWLGLFLAAGTAGNLLMTYGFRFVRATTGSVLQASEAVFAASWAWVFLGEIPSALQAAGGSLLLASVLALSAVRVGRVRDDSVEG
ncbi:MAG: DMT family transporter [Planctomycetes bacterium]|nr:DMT family transporter [Planctomycetota bacterium]